MNTTDAIRRLAAVTDEEAARLVGAETRADLAERIMATDVPAAAPRRVRRLALPLAAAAAAAAVVAGVYAVHPGGGGRIYNGPAGRRINVVDAAALTFSTQGKYLVVRVRDPLADPARYKREFAAHGLKIDLRLVPASPSVVGTVVFMDGGDGIKTIDAKGECYTGGGACPVGVRIPIDYGGQAGITFGRAARPGEKYDSTVSSFAPGEELHCVDVRRKTVGATLALLKKHKMSAALFNYDTKPNYAVNVGPGKIPDTWYVRNAEPYAPGQVMLFVQKDKPALAGDTAYYQRLFKGCR